MPDPVLALAPNEFIAAINHCKSATQNITPLPTSDAKMGLITKHAADFFQGNPEKAAAFAVRFLTAVSQAAHQHIPANESLFRFAASAPLTPPGKFDPKALAEAAGQE